MKNKLMALIGVAVLMICCRPAAEKTWPPIAGEVVSYALAAMTDVMLEDITNPPLASRFFVYAALAGYEVASHHTDSLLPMQGKLNDYPVISHAASNTLVHPTLAACLAMVRTAASMQPTGHKLRIFENRLLDSMKQAGVSGQMLLASSVYADSIVVQVLRYAASDGYMRISNYQRYQPRNMPGYWHPTPPANLAAVEPYFGTLRTLVLDSGQQVKPPRAAGFSTEPHSIFMQQLRETYHAGKTEEEKAIAAFWDCNPFAMKDLGHLLVGEKKISPGAHWVGIAGIAARQLGLDFNATLRMHCILSIGLFDAFISCWSEKYRSDRIRPETAVRQLIDTHWYPLLQTPPFPEYTSGHSVISTCSAELLTALLPQPLHYSDTVEVHLGLPARQYASFREAAEEAAISRLYGGIHFRDAIEAGQVQGREIAAHIKDRLISRNTNTTLGRH